MSEAFGVVASGAPLPASLAPTVEEAGHGPEVVPRSAATAEVEIASGDRTRPSEHLPYDPTRLARSAGATTTARAVGVRDPSLPPPAERRWSPVVFALVLAAATAGIGWYVGRSGQAAGDESQSPASEPATASEAMPDAPSQEQAPSAEPTPEPAGDDALPAPLSSSSASTASPAPPARAIAPTPRGPLPSPSTPAPAAKPPPAPPSPVPTRDPDFGI